MNTPSRRPSFRAVASLLAAISLAGTALAAAPAHHTTLAHPATTNSSDPYTRAVEGPGGVMTLEICARTFRKAANNGDGWPRLRLVGAVHIADKSFYDAMQSSLDENALVLFEGVKPPGTGPIDANLDDTAKAKATQQRAKFLLLVVDQFREKEGRFPADIADLLEHGGKRWKTVVEGCLTDAWSRPLTLTILAKEADKDSEFEEPAKQAPAVTSTGADGKAGTADDLRAEGTPVAIAKKASSGESTNIQGQMAKALGLTFQLDHMDSGKPNWRSCDMDVEELQKRMEETGADSSGLLKMLDGSSLMGRFTGWILGMVGKSPQLSTMLKVVMVETLARSEDMLSRGGPGGAGGPAGLAGMQAMMKVILIDRNEVVMRDLKAILEKERALKDVAVFYGAGHMADLEKRIIEELGYEVESDIWTPAIRVDPKDGGMTAEQAKAMRESMRKMIEGAR